MARRSGRARREVCPCPGFASEPAARPNAPSRSSTPPRRRPRRPWSRNCAKP